MMHGGTEKKNNLGKGSGFYDLVLLIPFFFFSFGVYKYVGNSVVEKYNISNLNNIQKTDLSF